MLFWKILLVAAIGWIIYLVYINVQYNKNTAPNTPQNSPANKPTPKRFIEIVLPPRKDELPKFLPVFFTNHTINEYTAFFKDGELYDVEPRNKNLPIYEDREVAYKARYIVSDGIKYDLEDAESINNIPIPDFSKKQGNYGVVCDLSYIFKMKAGAETRPELVAPMVYKAVNLMKKSGIGWVEKDYFKLVTHLWSLGETYYGDYLLDKLHAKSLAKSNPTPIKTNTLATALRNNKEFGGDYIEVSYLGAVCEKCAPYQNRIYCVSGRDKKYPKLPDFIKENNGLHCNIGIFSVVFPPETITKYIYGGAGDCRTVEVDAVKHSNRPFIDDRSEHEKRNYKEWKAEQEKQYKKDEKTYNRETWTGEYQARIEYQGLVDLLGEKAPKSFTGYKRMKSTNSTNFQKLVKIAGEHNLIISH